jgi:hypothetical protein
MAILMSALLYSTSIDIAPHTLEYDFSPFFSQ